MVKVSISYLEGLVGGIRKFHRVMDEKEVAKFIEGQINMLFLSDINDIEIRIYKV